MAAPALAGATISLGDTTLAQEECKGYVVRVTGEDPVVVGGRLLGHTSDATDWRACKDRNGAGFYTKASGNARFVGNRLSNIGTDGYRIASGVRLHHLRPDQRRPHSRRRLLARTPPRHQGRHPSLQGPRISDPLLAQHR